MNQQASSSLALALASRNGLPSILCSFRFWPRRGSAPPFHSNYSSGSTSKKKYPPESVRLLSYRKIIQFKFCCEQIMCHRSSLNSSTPDWRLAAAPEEFCLVFFCPESGQLKRLKLYSSCATSVGKFSSKKLASLPGNGLPTFSP